MLYGGGTTVAASRRLLIVCWKASLTVFALDTTSHWVTPGTVSHAPPRNGKHGFATAVPCSLISCATGQSPSIGKWGRGTRLGLPSCQWKLSPPKNLGNYFWRACCSSSILPWFSGGLCWSHEEAARWSSLVLVCLCCYGHRNLFLCLLPAFCLHFTVPWVYF